jgi:hypothetical protein
VPVVPEAFFQARGLRCWWGERALGARPMHEVLQAPRRAQAGEGEGGYGTVTTLTRRCRAAV